MPSTTAHGVQSNLYEPPRFSFSHPFRNPHMTATVTHIAAARDAAPAHLGEHGRRLWRDIITDHGIDDAGGRAMLLRACEALDRLRQVQVQIAADGLLVPGYRKQPRPHPLLAVEAEQTRIILACFRTLNLDFAP